MANNYTQCTFLETKAQCLQDGSYNHRLLCKWSELKFQSTYRSELSIIQLQADGSGYRYVQKIRGLQCDRTQQVLAPAE
jgi:hypothetical protein